MLDLMEAATEKGNIEYLSDEFRRWRNTRSRRPNGGMEVSFNFGGPGWVLGGDSSARGPEQELVPAFGPGGRWFPGPSTSRNRPGLGTRRSDITLEDPLIAVADAREGGSHMASDRARRDTRWWKVPEGK
jgi:hypothetical protein